MFESAELNHDISKAVYRREQAKLRQALLEAQNELRQNARFAVLILIAGVEGAGKGETVNLLNEWMDPRFIQTHAFGAPSDEETERPHMWRFWRALPPKGAHRHLLRRLAYPADPGPRDGPNQGGRVRPAASRKSSASKRCCATRACCCSSSGFIFPRSSRRNA